MTDDPFFDRLRREAAALRYDGDAAMRTRIAARIRARIAAQPTVTQLLASWFRPLAASLAALGLAACIGLVFVTDNPSDDTLTFGSNPVEVSVAGDYV
ncbi:MAG TPA: hypothetical protein VGR02_09975, partial [Thermoanaerobaculia bacterium]|nr:hypothetical protein [Thermoanaerobaculia bacterium]